MMKPKKIGIVGVGVIAEVVHLPGIQASPDLTLTALCDINEERLAHMAGQLGIAPDHCFTDYRDLIACSDVELVDIATPNDCHFEIAYAAAQAGKPYSVEKPITMTVEQAKQLEALTREKGLPSMVCFSYRFRSSARYARELVQSGELGDIYHVTMQYFQSWGLPCRNTPLVWRFDKKRTGTGALGDLGSHALDLVRFVTGREYAKLVGQAATIIPTRALPGGGEGIVDVDDYCNYLTELDNGVSASFQITRFAYGRGNHQRMEVYGSKGTLIYTLDRYGNIDELELCKGAAYDEAHAFVKIPAPDRFRSEQMQAFADLVNGKGDGLAATIEDGLANQIAMQAVVDSCETGQWVVL